MANRNTIVGNGTYLYVDVNFLQQLYTAGGVEAWNRVFSKGDKIVVTSVIREEMEESHLSKDFKKWMKKNGQDISEPDITVEKLNEADPDRKTPYKEVGGGKGMGDASIRLHLKHSLMDHPNSKFQLLSGDKKLVNFFITERKRVGTRMLAPHRGVFGFLRTELLEGRMTNEDYDAYTRRIRENFRVLESISAEFRDRGETAQQVRESKQVWKTGDYPDPCNEDKVFRDANRARVQAEREALKASQAGQPEIGVDDKGGSNSRQNLLGTPKPGDVLRAVGVIGDVVEFTQVVEEASKLIEHDRTPEAEQLLFAYVGGIGGSAVGGAAAGMAAGAAISATGVGALVGVPLAIISVLVGGYLGDAAGREITSYMVREIQTRQANGETIVVDDIIELFEDYSDANDLDFEGLEIPKSELDLSGLNSQTGPTDPQVASPNFLSPNRDVSEQSIGATRIVDGYHNHPQWKIGDEIQNVSGGAKWGDAVVSGQSSHGLHDHTVDHVTSEAIVAAESFQLGIGFEDDLLPDGVNKGLERRKNRIEQFNRTNNEQSPAEPPIPRPRPKLNPITEGFLKDMPDDGRLVLVAEMAGQQGRKNADTAEAERLARFDVQRKKAQDLNARAGCWLTPIGRSRMSPSFYSVCVEKKLAALPTAY